MSMEGLNWIIRSMKASFSFDAIQILWWCPENKKYYEVFREGYNNLCAASLNYDFPMIYPPGFTQVRSSTNILPLSISDCNEIMQPPFKETNIYSEYLNKNGYCDGISLELTSSENHLGLIHFSSFNDKVYNINVRLTVGNFGEIIESWMQEFISYKNNSHGYMFFNSKDENNPDFEIIKKGEKDIEIELILKTLENYNQSKKEIIFHKKNIYKISAIDFPNGNNLIEIIPSNTPNNLTKKELDVISLLVYGKTDREISELLFLGERTINSHISSILRKLEVNNRVEAAVYAVLSEIVVISTEDLKQKPCIGYRIKSSGN